MSFDAINNPQDGLKYLFSKVRSAGVVEMRVYDSLRKHISDLQDQSKEDQIVALRKQLKSLEVEKSDLELQVSELQEKLDKATSVKTPAKKPSKKKTARKTSKASKDDSK